LFPPANHGFVSNTFTRSEKTSRSEKYMSIYTVFVYQDEKIPDSV
jgi:hypothetical protein